MTSYEIDVQPQIDLPEGVTVEQFVGWADAVLRHETQPANSSLALVITDDEHIRGLNRHFRKVDSATDVLSFPAEEGDAFVTPEEIAPYLGDIIISLPTAERQAAEEQHLLRDELALLVVHGCLHLLGYDHGTDEEQQCMWAVQDEILSSLRD